jgi:hypothetical protein
LYQAKRRQKTAFGEKKLPFNFADLVLRLKLGQNSPKLFAVRQHYATKKLFILFGQNIGQKWWWTDVTLASVIFTFSQEPKTQRSYVEVQQRNRTSTMCFTDLGKINLTMAVQF